MSAHDYYRQVTDQDIGEVARELLGARIQREAGNSLHCDCPNHASQSHESLHIMLDRQGWYCFGCQVGGDVLQLVEFVQSGQVTVGVTGRMPETHRAARDYLAQRVRLHRLGMEGATAEEIAEADAARARELRVHGVLTRLADLYHQRLMGEPKVLAWLERHYAISRATIEKLRIGYASNEPWADGDGGARPGVVAALTGGPEAFTEEELVASGAFRRFQSGDIAPFFRNRLVFPYWIRSRVVFAIGRKTPWTPKAEYEKSKYKKLPVHDPKRRPEVAPCISNDHLFNEDALIGRPERVVITEGVTDCITLMDRGFAAVSPVTVRVKAADWDRLLARLKGTGVVYICQDNEVSAVGLTAALETAQYLVAHGVDARLVVLPLGRKHTEARRRLVDEFGFNLGASPKAIHDHRDALPEEQKKVAAELLADAKIDVNEYFAAGATASDFERLMAEGRTPLEYSILDLDRAMDEATRNQKLRPVLEAVAALDPMERSRHLKLIQTHFGSAAISLGTLREQVKSLAKALAKKQRDAIAQGPRVTASPGSCRARVEEILRETAVSEGKANFARAAEAAFDWFVEQGGRFFRTPGGEPFVSFQNRLYWMDNTSRGTSRLYQAMIYQHAEIVPTDTAGRTFYSVLSNLAASRGEVRTHLSWLHTDVLAHTVYFNLNNERNEIAKITPEGVELIPNGCNADGVLLTSSTKMLPLNFLPEADPSTAEKLIEELIVDKCTCSREAGWFSIAWLTSFLLLEFVGTRPALRFEGCSGSGKTTLCKLLSVLLFGEAQQKKATDAANYTDAAQNPLLILDNIEAKQCTDALRTFLLTAVTGITKEKRRSGSDTETVQERAKCLIVTTGVEPLGGEFSEVLSRSFTIQFALDEDGGEPFLEPKVEAAIRQQRDLLLSDVMRRTSLVLAMIRDGALERVMSLLHASLGAHAQRRANDYLAVMYLMTIAGEPPAVIVHHLRELQPEFAQQVRRLNEVSNTTARESNPIATVLGALFGAHRRARAADCRSEAPTFGPAQIGDLTARYQIDITPDGAIRGVSARELYVALNRFARDFSLGFPLTSVQQFAQRFANDLGTIRSAGFEVEMAPGAGRRRTYTIRERQALPAESERYLSLGPDLSPQNVLIANGMQRG